MKPTFYHKKLNIYEEKYLPKKKKGIISNIQYQPEIIPYFTKNKIPTNSSRVLIEKAKGKYDESSQTKKILSKLISQPETPQLIPNTKKIFFKKNINPKFDKKIYQQTNPEYENKRHQNLSQIYSDNKKTERNNYNHLINHKFSDNIMINNNNTICISCDNNNQFGIGKINQNFNDRPINSTTTRYNLFSSPRNQLSINSKTLCLDNLMSVNRFNPNIYEEFSERNKHRRNIVSSGNILQNRSKNKNKLENRIILNYNLRNEKRISYLNIKKRFNSTSLNMLGLIDNFNFHTPTNNKNKNKNKIAYPILKKANKINHIIIKKKAIKKENNDSNKNVLSKSENFTFYTKKHLIKSKTDKEYMNSFIIKLTKLYTKSTGFNINKDNDLNSILTILYNWVENLNEINILGKKTINEKIKNQTIRKILEKYKVTDELKNVLSEIIENE